jgi:DNA-binding transcriptional MerR regulator
VSEDGEQQKLKLKWCKPGALSRQVGVGLSILRNWAKANLVRTIVSPGGHRLFHVQSVLQHIGKTKVSSSKSRRNKSQLVAYVCVDVSNRNRAQLEAMGEQITNQVTQHYGISEDNCSIVVELQTDAKRPEQRLTFQTIQVTDTPGIRLLLTKISNRSCSKVVLRRTEDISSTPSTYAFFLLLCQSLNISVEIVPELFRHAS